MFQALVETAIYPGKKWVRLWKRKLFNAVDLGIVQSSLKSLRICWTQPNNTTLLTFYTKSRLLSRKFRLAILRVLQLRKKLRKTTNCAKNIRLLSRLKKLRKVKFCRRVFAWKALNKTLIKYSKYMDMISHPSRKITSAFYDLWGLLDDIIFCQRKYLVFNHLLN